MACAVSVAVAACASPEAAPTVAPVTLTADERKAVAVAEKYLVEQCFTSLPCDATSADLRIDFGADGRLIPPAKLEELRGRLVAMRRGRFLPTAFGISGPADGPGERREWTVYFEPGKQDLKEPHLGGVLLGVDFGFVGFVGMDSTMNAPRKVLRRAAVNAPK